jgi:hypothetical protein
MIYFFVGILFGIGIGVAIGVGIQIDGKDEWR